MDQSLQKSSNNRKQIHHWLVLSVTSLGVLLVLLNVGTLNVALPIVSQHFHAGSLTANWIVLSYLLFSTILILVFGQLADIFGRKILYMIGIATFTLASLLIGFSPNVWILILLRCIQGAGGALVITNTTALITDAFPRHLLGTGLGINVLIASLAQLLGPVLGGLMASSFGWKWVFWFNVPFGLLGFVWGFFTLRSSAGPTSKEKIDVLGGIVVFLALGGLIVALSESGTLGWNNGFVLAGLLCFLVFCPVFIIIEKHVSSPLIDLTLFHNRAYTMANIATFINFFSTTAITLLIALYYQAVDQETAFQAGLKVLPVTVGMLISSPVAGNLTRKFSSRFLSTFGLCLSSIGLLLLIVIMAPQTPYWMIGFGMLLIGIGFGMFLTPNTTFIMTNVPENRRGIANGLRSMLNNMGQVLSTAVSLMVVTISLPAGLRNVIYNGASSSLSMYEIHQISGSYRLAFIVFFAVSILGIIASLLRGKKVD